MPPAGWRSPKSPRHSPCLPAGPRGTNSGEQVRAQLWELLGKLPPRPKLPKVETLSTEDRGDYVVEKFRFDNGAGATVPGYLLRPKELRGKAPAILYCHWHGGEYEIGKEELFQAKHTPEPPGPAFAKRGFVVLGIDAYCFGERNGRGPGGPAEKGGAGEMSASKFNLWVGRTLWGMMLRDDLMALDYLASRPEVDARRIGVTGMSMGATRSWWLMALDERIRDWRGRRLPDALPEPDRARNAQGARHLLLCAGPAEPFRYRGGGGLARAAAGAVHERRPGRRFAAGRDSRYRAGCAPGVSALRQRERLPELHLRRAGHVYTPEMWAKTLAWMEEKLGGGKPEVIGQLRPKAKG